MSEKLTNTGLVKHAKTMLGLPTSYMWGTLARKIDSGTIDWCRKTYPSMYSADRVAYLRNQIGKWYGCDCVGLIKSYYFGGVGSPKYTANRDYNTKVLPSIRKHGMYAVDQLISNPDLAIQAFTALKEEREQRKALESQIEKDAPKVLFADAVAASHTSILTGELAKLLKQNGVEIGQNRLFAWLRDNGYLIRRKGSDYNMPTQKSMEMELFEVKERTIHDPNGSVRVIKTPKVTGKGQQYFINKFLGVPAQ